MCGQGGADVVLPDAPGGTGWRGFPGESWRELERAWMVTPPPAGADPVAEG